MFNVLFVEYDSPVRIVIPNGGGNFESARKLRVYENFPDFQILCEGTFDLRVGTDVIVNMLLRLKDVIFEGTPEIIDREKLGIVTLSGFRIRDVVYERRRFLLFDVRGNFPYEILRVRLE